MKRSVQILMILAAGFGVLAWAGAFTPQAAGQAPTPPPAFVPGTESGFATFQTQCASCHGNPNVDRAPTPNALREMTPEKIYAAMATGVMQQQSSALNDGQKKALAEFMAGWPMGAPHPGTPKHGLPVPHQPALADPAAGPRGTAGARISRTHDFNPRRSRA
jgi:mono/diheme cytochrome c family protein